MIRDGIDLAQLDMEDFLTVLTRWHPELKAPVAFPDFCAMARREGVVVRMLALSRPARLVRMQEVVGIQLNHDLPERQWAFFGMHELCHFWRDDDATQPCFYADDEWRQSPREDFAETFAWYVTSAPRYVSLRRLPPYRTLRTQGRMFDAGGTFPTQVVGTSYRSAAIEALCGGRQWDEANRSAIATLVLEDENPHDPNAVKIEICRRHVGYLCREDAVRYRNMLQQLTLSRGPHWCAAHISGGWERGGGDRGHYGVRLDLALRPLATAESGS